MPREIDPKKVYSAQEAADELIADEDPKKVYSAQEAADELIADGSDDGRLLSEDSEEEFSDEERNRDNEGDITYTLTGDRG